MVVLGIDTSNKAMGIAIQKDGVLLGEHLATNQKNHSVTLMPAIDFLMSENNLTPKDLTKIVVAKGPGSYTGLRIGVTTGKTLAWTLGVPLYAMSSLKVLAGSIPQELVNDAIIIPIMDARRDNVYAGAYCYKERALVSVIADKHCHITQLLSELVGINKPLLFVGNDLPAFKATIQSAFPDAKLQATTMTPRTLVDAVIESERVTDLDGFVPAYLKRVEAEEKWLETHQLEDTDYVKRV